MQKKKLKNVICCSLSSCLIFIAGCSNGSTSAKNQSDSGQSGRPKISYNEAELEAMDLTIADTEELRKEAERGVADAQNKWGVLLSDGDGVEQDCAEAVKWFQKAADQGLADAQFNLGVMYDEGEGIEEDNQVAIKWYRLAAFQGNDVAQFNLGVMYDEGEGVEEDNQEAIKWYRLAAMQGNEAAQYCLGVTYLNGEVGEPDLAEAFAWLTLADESEETSAAEELEAIKKSATANQLKQGKKKLAQLRKQFGGNGEPD